MRYTIFIFMVIIMTSCEKEVITHHSLNIEPTASFNGEEFHPDSIYVDYFGNRLRFDEFQFYLSDIQLTGSKTEMVNEDYLVNMMEETDINFIFEKGDYNNLSFGIGVPADRNKDQDPTQYPNDHPLSVKGAQGMFWEWNTGYIFVKVGGKSDGGSGGELNQPFAFHCGEDFLYQNYGIESHLKDGENKLRMHFELDKFFKNDLDSINLQVDFLTHTSGNVDLAKRFMDGFNQSLSIELE